MHYKKQVQFFPLQSAFFRPTTQFKKIGINKKKEADWSLPLRGIYKKKSIIF